METGRVGIIVVAIDQRTPSMARNAEIRKIAFIGDYLPRKCGIATFTHDLRQAVADAVSGHRMHRRAGQRRRRRLRLSARSALRDRGTGARLVSPGGRFPELLATSTSSGCSTSSASTAAPRAATFSRCCAICACRSSPRCTRCSRSPTPISAA